MLSGATGRAGQAGDFGGDHFGDVLGAGGRVSVLLALGDADLAATDAGCRSVVCLRGWLWMVQASVAMATIRVASETGSRYRSGHCWVSRADRAASTSAGKPGRGQERGSRRWTGRRLRRVGRGWPPGCSSRWLVMQSHTAY